MDKTRDVRRVKASRFSSANGQIIKQSGLDCKKLKREKVRRLSFVGRVCSNNSDCEMASVQSDGEDEFRLRNSTSKRFKLPKKFYDDCNTVDHASVPRKLRSAIKKRTQESVSPPFPESRKLNHTANGVELLRKDRVKKSKLKHPEESEGSPGQATIRSISKDEEEVVETLYALAGMFSDTENTHKIDSDGKPSKAKSLALPEAENSMPVFKEVEKDSKIVYPTTEAEAAPQSSNVEGSAGETVEIQNSKQGIVLELHTSKQFPMELQSYIPKSNYPAVSSLFSKSTPASERQSSSSAALNCSERSWGTGLNQSLHYLNMDSDKNKEIDVGSVADFRSHHELQPTIKENKNYGSGLWPGLSSTGFHNAERQEPSVKFSPAKLPAWLGNSTSTARPCSAGNAVLAEKEARPPIDAKKSWKKCSAHVYISRLIKVLQITEGKDGSPLQPTQLTTHEGLKQGASEANKLQVVIKNGSTGVVSTIGVARSAADKSLNEVNNAILLHKRLLEDQQQASTTSGPYVSQKQSFNFLSLPSGGCGVEAKGVVDRPGNGPGLEPSTQYHVPYLHTFPQNHTTMPVSLPQNHHVSTYLDHHSASGAPQKVQIQLPPYLSNSVSGAFPSSMTTVFPKQLQQQQQRFWAAQLAAPNKPGEFAAAHITNWQNGRQESPCIMQYGHQLEVLGPRYIPVSLQQQQQQFVSNTSVSSPQSRVQRYHHHHNGGIFRPDGASSLQLLCNERL